MGSPRHFGSSIKGQAEIDWDDEPARKVFLQGIVALRLQRAGLLLQLPCQDSDEKGRDGLSLRQGVATDNIVSAHDHEP